MGTISSETYSDILTHRWHGHSEEHIGRQKGSPFEASHSSPLSWLWFSLLVTHYTSASTERQWHPDAVSSLNSVSRLGHRLPSGDPPASLPCFKPTRLHCYHHPDGNRASGGSAILAKNCIHCKPVNICSPQQDTAVRVNLPSLCVTLPPAKPASPIDLTNLIEQSRLLLIPLGDFSAKNICKLLMMEWGWRLRTAASTDLLFIPGWLGCGTWYDEANS
jgi:hypothetical protein